ncbi:MAG TPA: hypothetical protein VEC11_03075 [Allosphingosinicella sp.]|nr:hypothetical protein [Allosphingosinicella sp.]
MRVFVALASVALVATPAFAQGGSGAVSGSAGELATQSNTPESTGSGGQGADGERRICRRVETGSQSRMTYRRVCRTAEEWRASQRTQ